MKHAVMALEELTVVEEPIIEVPDLDIGTEMERHQEDEETLGYTADLSEHFKASDAVMEVVDMLESTNEKTGVSAPVCEAISLVIEQLIKHTEASFPSKLAFEEFATQRSAIKNKQTALEGFKDIAKRVWQAIIHMLQRMSAWFKKTFTRHKLHSVLETQRLQKVQDKVQQVKSSAPKTEGIESTFVDRKIIGYLNAQGKVPTGAALIQHAHDHFELIKRMYESFSALDQSFLAALDGAFGAINQKNNDFQNAIGECFDLALASPIRTKASGDFHLPSGISMYEQPLIFGGQSYYRTGAHGVAQVDVKDVKAFLAPSSRHSSVNFEQPLEKLELVQTEAMLTILKKWHEENDRRQEHITNDINNRFDDLTSKSNQLNRMELDDRTAGRARMLSKALSMYYVLRVSVMVGLNNYDERIRDALLTYATKSI